MTAEHVPLKRIPVRPNVADEDRKKAREEVRDQPKAVRDAEGRVLPGLTVARYTGTVLAPGTLVPAGGADFHKQDRSVEFLAVGATVPATSASDAR